MMKLTSILAGLLTGTLAWAAEQNVFSQDDLAQAFAAPPHEAKPWVYWWFLGGYGNPEGMARDIAAMKEKGLGGVMHMQTINAGGRPLPKEPKMLSPDWEAWFGEMLRVAHTGGMTLSASILDGWSHGGWWIDKENGAKQLVYSETQVDGPAAITESLPQPFTQLGLYRDVVVVAFKERTARPPTPREVRANHVHGRYCGEENWPASHATDSDPETRGIPAGSREALPAGGTSCPCTGLAIGRVCRAASGRRTGAAARNQVVGFQVGQPWMVGLAAESLRGTRRGILWRRRQRSLPRKCWT